MLQVIAILLRNNTKTLQVRLLSLPHSPSSFFYLSLSLPLSLSLSLCITFVSWASGKFLFQLFKDQKLFNDVMQLSQVRIQVVPRNFITLKGKAISSRIGSLESHCVIRPNDSNFNSNFLWKATDDVGVAQRHIFTKIYHCENTYWMQKGAPVSKTIHLINLHSQIIMTCYFQFWRQFVPWQPLIIKDLT